MHTQHQHKQQQQRNEKEEKSIRLKTKCSGFVQICVIYCESGHLGSNQIEKKGIKHFCSIESYHRKMLLTQNDCHVM